MREAGGARAQPLQDSRRPLQRGWGPCSHLHADDRVDEEQHDNQQGHVGQGLGARWVVTGLPSAHQGPQVPPERHPEPAWHSPGAAGWTAHLEGLDESPQQGPHPLCPVQQLDQPHDPEQAEEGAGDAGAFVWVLQGSSPGSQPGGGTSAGSGAGGAGGGRRGGCAVGDPRRGLRPGRDRAGPSWAQGSGLVQLGGRGECGVPSVQGARSQEWPQGAGPAVRLWPGPLPPLWGPLPHLTLSSGCH